MMRSLVLAVAVAAGLPVVGVTSIAAVSAEAAAAPGWQLHYFSLPGGTMTINSVAASGPDNAWAVGNGNSPPTGSLADGLIERWNGTAWHPMKVSRAVSTAADGPVGTSSAADVWAFGSGYAYWNGHRWRTGALPSLSHRSPAITATAVFGPSSVWAFGGINLGGASGAVRPYAAHRTAAGWGISRLPASVAGLDTEIIAASAVSATDTWVLAGNARTMSGGVLLHWNGKGWARVRYAPAMTSMGLPESLVALAATSVWVDVSPRGSGTANVLWHWNGHGWASVASPADANIDPISGEPALASDGHGGIWAFGAGTVDRLYKTWDYSAGAWTGPSLISSAPNVVLWGVVQVPRAGALWAYGMSTEPANVTDGVVAGYRP